MHKEAPLQSLHGHWLLQKFQDRTLAVDLATREQIELDGELHTDLHSGGTLVREVARLGERLAPLAAVLEEPEQPLTLGALLRGAGWRLLFLELTGRCNERCSHCYAESSPEVGEALSWKEIQEVIVAARTLGFDRIQFTGGDPLVSPHIKEAIVFARQHEFPKVEVYTNALAFNETLADHFVEHGVSMAVSLYSHDPKVHDAVTRTVDSHARTSRNIKLALSRGITVRIGGVEGIEDGQDEQKLREYVRTLGIQDDMVAVDVQREVGRGAWNESAGLLPNKSRGHMSSNDQHGGRLCVNYLGDVVPCIFDRSNVLGNIRKTSLEACLARPLSPLMAPTPRLQVLERPLACVQCRFRRELLEGMS